MGRGKKRSLYENRHLEKKKRRGKKKEKKQWEGVSKITCPGSNYQSSVLESSS